MDLTNINVITAFGFFVLFSISMLYFILLFKFNKNKNISYQKLLRQKKALEVEVKSINKDLTSARSQMGQEKMLSLSGLFGGVAHELNTPVGICGLEISSVEAHSEQVKEKLSSGIKKSELDAFVVHLDRSLLRMKRSNEQIKNLVAKFRKTSLTASAEDLCDFDVGKSINDLIDTLSSTFEGKRIKFSVKGPEDKVVLEIDRVVFNQIIINLVMNSVKHGFDKREDGAIDISFSSKDDNLELIYADNGIGIAEDIQSKIFEPFFTTKPGEQGGTGLGLSIIYNIIVHNLEGKVELEPQEKGAKFLISIPIIRIDKDEADEQRKSI